MRPDESTHAEDWLRIARKDLSRCRHLLAEDDPEAAGFFLQQALEKYLKAFLLSKGWLLKRIHDLEMLLNDCLRYDASLEPFRSLCQRVTDYYFVERYPLTLEAGIDAEDVRQSLSEAETLARKIEAQMA